MHLISAYTKLAVLVMALCLALAVGIDARRKRCRRCSCTVTIGPYVGGAIDGKDGFMDSWTDIYTGGDKYWWTATAPNADNNYTSVAHFPRLCGNGKTLKTTIGYNFWLTNKTAVTLDCNCDKNVRCRGGSKCELSGLL